jgi:hypothetical protein
MTAKLCLRQNSYGVSPDKSQKEAQEDQGRMKELRGSTPSHFNGPWSSWPSYGASLAQKKLLKASYRPLKGL